MSTQLSGGAKQVIALQRSLYPAVIYGYFRQCNYPFTACLMRSFLESFINLWLSDVSHVWTYVFKCYIRMLRVYSIILKGTKL